MHIDGSKLRSIRVKMKIPQKVLSSSIGVSQVMISMIESGKRHLSPTPQTAERLASALSCNVKDLTINGEQPLYLKIEKLAGKLTEERQRIVLQIINEFLF